MTAPLDLVASLVPAREQVLLAAVDGFWVFLAVMVISAISNWLQKKNQPPDDEPAGDDETEPAARQSSRLRQDDARQAALPPPPLSQPSPAAKTVDWEEEMRRILGEAPPPPPPPIVVQAPRPAPPPLPAPAHHHEPLVPELRSGEEGSYDEAEDVHTPLSKLQQASQAFLRGHSLHEKVQEHLKQVDHRTEHARPEAVRVRHRGQSAESAAAVAMLRRPATLRQAMVLSVVLSPPKAME